MYIIILVPGMTGAIMVAATTELRPLLFDPKLYYIMGFLVNVNFDFYDDSCEGLVRLPEPALGPDRDGRKSQGGPGRRAEENTGDSKVLIKPWSREIYLINLIVRPIYSV